MPSFNPIAVENPPPVRNGESSSQEKTIDETCYALLDDLFPRCGGPMWKATVILKLKVLLLPVALTSGHFRSPTLQHRNPRPPSPLNIINPHPRPNHPRSNSKRMVHFPWLSNTFKP
jgi:hypothetical protein